jgi:signal transduction histidine kinase
MPLGLLISDAENRIVYANGAMESMLQSPSASLHSGFFTLDAVFPDFKRFLAAVSGAEPRGGLFETTCKIRDGGSLEVLVGLAILNPEGSASARQIAVFVADLTLQKKSEETLRRTEKLAVAGRLAAAIAHEINNPLAALTNCLYLIAQFDLSDEPRRLLEIAQSELNRVSQITVQTLRFHRSSMHARLADLHELIETVLALLGSRFAQQGIVIERRYGVIPHILMHDGEIRQLIANLVSNAVDALPYGGRIVIHTVLTDEAKDGRPGVRLSVADNGIGMDAATRLRIFEPFFSTKGTTGTGLGLWISREIAAKQGGRLRVRSCRATPGRRGGTVFTVFLRLDTSNAANAA